LAGAAVHRRADEVESAVEALDELGGDDVVPERLVGPGDALGELEDEVALEHLGRQVEQLADGGVVGGRGGRWHGRVLRQRSYGGASRSGWPAGWRRTPGP